MDDHMAALQISCSEVYPSKAAKVAELLRECAVMNRGGRFLPKIDKSGLCSL